MAHVDDIWNYVAINQQYTNQPTTPTDMLLKMKNTFETIGNVCRRRVNTWNNVDEIVS